MTVVPCPACGAPAVYARELDRFVHQDGSANWRCWVTCSRGDDCPPHEREVAA